MAANLALSRRQMLRLLASAVAAAALAPTLDRSAQAKKPGPSSIAIIGGGVAGLGGRMFTQYDFYKGMFCKLGGEFVDTAHEDLQTLGKELGVKMQNLTTEDGDDLYFF
jgi:hypothetical protein